MALLTDLRASAPSRGLSRSPPSSGLQQPTQALEVLVAFQRPEMAAPEQAQWQLFSCCWQERYVTGSTVIYALLPVPHYFVAQPLRHITQCAVMKRTAYTVLFASRAVQQKG